MINQELHLRLEHAKAGMTLARALIDTRGEVLMAPGMELSDATIAALHRRNVTELWVLDLQPQAADPKNQEAALRQHHHGRLARLFRHVNESPDHRYLLDLMTRYRGTEAP